MIFVHCARDGVNYITSFFALIAFTALVLKNIQLCAGKIAVFIARGAVIPNCCNANTISVKFTSYFLLGCSRMFQVCGKS